VARTADARGRADLLARVADYVYENGVADLSFRPLAAALDVSPGILVYHFGSKESLIGEVLQGARARQQEGFASLGVLEEDKAIDVCRKVWKAMSAPKLAPLFRLFFEVYALALRDPGRFPGFLERAIGDWLAFLEGPRLRDGYSRADARALATIVLAGFRGFMLDLAASGDRKRVNRAVELWLPTLEAFPTAKELAR
jgi:AcrR family transcriptional regulator